MRRYVKKLLIILGSQPGLRIMVSR